MSTAIFTFIVHQPYRGEGGGHLTGRSTADGGREVRVARLPAEGFFRSRLGEILFPPNNPTTFQTFFDARQGGFDTFLFPPVFEVWREVRGESIGTGDGAEKDFALDSKYINASTLVAYEDGSPQAGISLINNNTAPLVRFDSAPSGSVALTADYDRYIPCRFDQDDFDFGIKGLGNSDANSILVVRGLTWRQDNPGSHLV
jgi:hypothetical protein